MLFVLCAVWPAVARAQSDVIDWIQQQSGPGPYDNSWLKLGAFNARLWCWAKDGVAPEPSVLRELRRCWIDNPNEIQWVLSFGGEFAHNYKDQLFLDDPTDRREISEWRFTTAVLYHANSVFDIGGTVDAVRFSSSQGNAFSFWRLGVGPRLMFTPCFRCKVPKEWGAVKRIVLLQLDSTFFPQGFKASDYGNTVSKFDSGPEFQARASVVLDGGALVQKLWP